MKRFLTILWLTSAAWLAVICPVLSESSLTSSQQLRQLSEIEHPLTSAETLVQSPTPVTAPSSEIVQVTGVKANPTDKGVEVILQTSKGEQLQIRNRSAGNSFIADIPNAQLRLPNGEAFTFRSQKPIAGITEITVTNQDVDTIRVTVTGEAGVPTVELFDSPDEGLIFSVQSAASSTPQGQQPQTQPTPEQDSPESQTQPSQPAAEGEEDLEIVVTGEQETGYSVPDATTATRTDTPIRDIPQSIQVVPQQVIREQQVIRLDEALRNVSGVTFGGDVQSRGEEYSIRGFDNVPTLRDGFRRYGSFETFPEVANLERVEVLKGPASILYGEIQPGGLINLVSKKPLSEPFYEAELQLGNWGFVRPRFDISGPLTSDGSLLYRLNGLYRRGDSFRGFDKKIGVSLLHQ